MTDTQYPPLPEPELTSIKVNSTGMRYTKLTSFSAEQMRAYLDVDRAQRKPLSALQCMEIAVGLDRWARAQMEESGLPLWDLHQLKIACKVIRAAINNPSRPDAGNTQE